MLRGYFDGGGLRKQNGHWQSGRAGVIPPTPPTPTGTIVDSYILRICGGNYLQTGQGNSIITRYFRPCFVPYDKGSGIVSQADDPAWDIGNNIGGPVYNDTYGSRYRYVNAIANRERIDGTAEQITTFNNYIDENGSATFYLSITPHSSDEDKNELEKNLCIIGKGSDYWTQWAEDYSPIPKGSFYIQSLTGIFPNSGIYDAIGAQNVVDRVPIALNLNRGLEFPNLWDNDNAYGFKIDDGLVVKGNPITGHLDAFSFKYGKTLTAFSFPSDYTLDHNINVPYLELEFKIYYE